MINDEIKKELFALGDSEYKDFSAKLIPNVDKEKFIGVRTPALRSYAKKLVKNEDIGDFLTALPHEYFDENQLHAMIISEIKDFDCCVKSICDFLPYVDNWATCDQMTPKALKKNKEELLKYIDKWINSGDTYTVRFGIKCLMSFFLDGDFKSEYLDTVAAVKSDEYYVNMMIAWYFATALAKQYDSAVKIIENKTLDKWTHNKAIQKARESFRVTPEHKEYLKTLKIS